MDFNKFCTVKSIAVTIVFSTHFVSSMRASSTDSCVFLVWIWSFIFSLLSGMRKKKKKWGWTCVFHAPGLESVISLKCPGSDIYDWG